MSDDKITMNKSPDKSPDTSAMAKIFTNPVYAALFAILCNVLWGSAYPAIKSGYEIFNITGSVCQKLTFAGIRFIAAGVLVLIFSAAAGKRFPRVSANNVPRVLALAVVYTALQYVFFYVGLSNTTGTNGSIVNSSQTFMAVILAHFLYQDDKLNPSKLFGTVLGFIGVLLITFEGGSISFTWNGEGFILIAALCFVIGSVISKSISKTEDPIPVTGYNLLVGGLILFSAGMAGGGRIHTENIASGAAILAYLAFLSAAAFALWTILLKYNPVGKISVFNFIIPVSGTILSAIFLKENIWEIKYLLSLIFITMGIFAVNKGKTQ